MYPKNVIAIALFFFSLGAHAQVSKLVLVKGKQYEVTTTAKTNSISTVMGQEMESTADITTFQKIEVKDTRASETDLVATISRLVAAVTGMGQQTDFDSDKKDNAGPGADEMAKVVNQPKHVTVDASGKLIRKDKEEEGDGPMLPGVSQGEGVSMFLAAFVGRNIIPGATWADSTVTGDKQKATTVGIYTVKSIQNNIAIIGFVGTTIMKGTMEQMGQEMEMNATSKVTSETKLDLATSLILESNLVSDGNMTVEAAGMSIPVTVKTAVSTKMKEL